MQINWSEERELQHRVFARLYSGQLPEPSDIESWVRIRREIHLALTDAPIDAAREVIAKALRDEEADIQIVEEGELAPPSGGGETVDPLFETARIGERLRWMQRLLEAVTREEFHDPANMIAGEIAWARRQAAEIGSVVPDLAEKSQSIEASARESRARLQCVSIDGWIQGQAEDEETGDPRLRFRQEWKRVLEFHDIVSALEDTDGELAARVAKIRQLHALNLRQGRAALEDMDLAGRRTALIDAANELEDQGASFISEGDFLDPREQLIKLETVVHSMGDMDTTVKGLDIGKASNDRETTENLRTLRKHFGRLRWMRGFCQRRARSVEVDSRLNAVFGKRMRRRFENFVFFLILLLVGLVGLEWYLDQAYDGLTPEWKALFNWADLGICSILLLDFFVRWHFARWSFWFIRHHFLLDFLPALPYGFIFGIIEAHLAAFTPVTVIKGLLLVRLVRILRFLRVFARLFRLVVFVLRGIDRLVQRFRGYLDRNILLFESDSVDSDQRPAEAELLEKEESRAILLTRELYRARTRTERTEFLEAYLRMLHFEAEQLRPSDFETIPRKPEQRDIRLEAVVSKFVACDAVLVESVLGQRGAERVRRTLRWIDLPVIRLLPVLRRFVSAARISDPLESTAVATREVGHFLQRVLSVFHVWGDLSGITTGPQILDRISTAMIRATHRPAVRLLIFGALFTVLYGVAEFLFWLNAPPPGADELTPGVEAVQGAMEDAGGESNTPPEKDGQGSNEDAGSASTKGHWLHLIVNALGRILGLPLIILGSLCLVINFTGRWFKRIAGEALDVYLRTSDAHFFPLLKTTKLGSFRSDLDEIRERVIEPECRVRGCAGAIVDQSVERLADRIEYDRSFADVRRPESALEADTFLSREIEQISLLYRDYLESAPLRRTDDHTSVQLLGNMAMRDIRSSTLGLGRKEARRLEKLALEKDRMIGTGPYLWFRLISESLSIETAKLVLEYNCSCIPRPRLEGAPQDQKERFENFLEGKKVALDPAARRKLRSGAAFAEAAMLTTEFHSLHFLTEDAERDATVAELFGDEVRDAMVRDRRAMVRDIFGTWPYHQLPRSVRRFNPYRFYFRYLAGARILLLPFVLTFQLLGWIWKSCSEIARVVREVLGKAQIQVSRLERVAGFDVATRKINRMRKPYFMETMKLRASVDVEYLGLRVPGTELSENTRTYEDDLEFIGALEREAIPFDQMRRSAVRDLRQLRQFLEERGWLGSDFNACTNILDPSGTHDGNHGEILRAVVTAFVTDSHDLRSIITGPQELRAFFNRVIGDPVPPGIFLRCWQVLFHDVIGRFLPRLRYRRKLFNDYVAQRENLRKLESRVRRQLLHAFLEAGANEVEHCEAALKMGESEHGYDAAILESLRRVVAEYPLWSRKLVTLRTIQTLTILDTRNYRDFIWALGGFHEEEAPEPSEEEQESGVASVP